MHRLMEFCKTRLKDEPKDKDFLYGSKIPYATKKALVFENNDLKKHYTSKYSGQKCI